MPGVVAIMTMLSAFGASHANAACEQRSTWTVDIETDARYDVSSYPRYPNVAPLNAVEVSNDAELDDALSKFGSEYDASTHYILCSDGTVFSSVRTIANSGLEGSPLIIAGELLDGEAEGAAVFNNWTVKGSHVWITGLNGENSGSEFPLTAVGGIEGFVVTQCLFEARNGVYVDFDDSGAPQNTRIGWNLFTGEGAPDVEGDDFVKFESGVSVEQRPEGTCIYRNRIESSEVGLSDESMGIMNRPGRKPSDGPALEDFLVLENWIVTGRKRGIYLKHGGEVVRNHVELPEGGLVIAVRGRGSKNANVFGNYGYGRSGSKCVVQGHGGLWLGNEINDEIYYAMYPDFYNNIANLNTAADGAKNTTLAGNKGKVRVGFLESNRDLKEALDCVWIEDHDGEVGDDDGAEITFVGGKISGSYPHVADNAEIYKSDTTGHLIPAVTDLEAKDCGPSGTGARLARKAWSETSYGSGLPSVDSGEECVVSPTDDLQALLGDSGKYRFVLEAGSFGPLVIDERAGEDVSRPLVIMAQSMSKESKPVFSSKVQVNRPNVYLYGLYFKDADGGAALEFVGGDHRSGGKVLRCYFENSTADFSQADMEVAYNEMWNVDGEGFEFVFAKMGDTAWDETNGGSAPGWEPGSDNWKDHPYGAFRPFIHHNYFHDWVGSGNGHEAFRIGSGNHHRLWEARGLAEYNVMENIKITGENETISLKSSLNVVRCNTLVNSQTISSRLGYGNKIHSNYMLDTAGIVLTDGRIVNGKKLGTEVLGNYLENTARGIHMYAGYSDPNNTEYLWNNGDEGTHPIPADYATDGHPLGSWNHASQSAAHYTVIAGNTFKDSQIQLGRPSGSAAYPITGTVMWGNQFLGNSPLLYTKAADTIPAEGEVESDTAPAGYEGIELPSKAVERLAAEKVGPEADIEPEPEETVEDKRREIARGMVEALKEAISQRSWLPFGAYLYSLRDVVAENNPDAPLFFPKGDAYFGDSIAPVGSTGALRNMLTGNFARIDIATGRIYADAESLEAAEVFRVEDLGDGAVSLTALVDAPDMPVQINAFSRWRELLANDEGAVPGSFFWRAASKEGYFVLRSAMRGREYFVYADRRRSGLMRWGSRRQGDAERWAFEQINLGPVYTEEGYIDFGATTVWDTHYLSESQGGSLGLAMPVDLDDPADGVKESLIVMDNGWPTMPFSRGIEESSYLAFSVDSDDVGEILAIGVDADNTHDTGGVPDGNGIVFQLSGTANYLKANQDYDTYEQGTGPRRYMVPLGSIAGTTVEQMAFILDDDEDASASSVFTNVRVVEADLEASFDENADGWSGFDSTQIALSTDQSVSGGSSLKATNRSKPFHAAEFDVFDILSSKDPLVTLNSRAYILNTGGTAQAKIIMKYKTEATGSAMQFATLAQANSTVTGEWVEIEDYGITLDLTGLTQATLAVRMWDGSDFYLDELVLGVE